MKEMNLNVLTYLSFQSKLNLHRTKTFFLFKSNLNGSINTNFYYARCRVLFNRKAPGSLYWRKYNVSKSTFLKTKFLCVVILDFSGSSKMPDISITKSIKRNSILPGTCNYCLFPR